MKMKLLLFTSIFIASNGILFAKEPPLQKTLEEEIDTKSTETSWVFRPEASVTFGYSSNAPLIQSPTSGAFTKLNPSLAIEYAPTDTFLTIGTFNGNLKYYPESSVGGIANEYGGSARVDVIGYVGDNWEIGGKTSIGFLETRSPVVGSTTVESQLQRYFNPEARVFGALLLDDWTFELGTRFNTRRYTTTTFDIQGNVFKNSYNELEATALVSRRFSKNTKAYLRSSFGRRFYLDRMAEFSDGLPAFIGTELPRLSTQVNKHEAELKYKLFSLDFSSSLGAEFEKDLVFGARDSTKLNLQQKITIRLPYRFSLEPSISLSRQKFSNFRSNLNDPQNSDLRLDWEQHASLPINFEVTKQMIVQAKYSFNNKNSNYNLQDYTEHLFETGLNVQF